MKKQKPNELALTLTQVITKSLTGCEHVSSHLSYHEHHDNSLTSTLVLTINEDDDLITPDYFLNIFTQILGPSTVLLNKINPYPFSPAIYLNDNGSTIMFTQTDYLYIITLHHYSM